MKVRVVDTVRVRVMVSVGEGKGREAVSLGFSSCSSFVGI